MPRYDPHKYKLNGRDQSESTKTEKHESSLTKLLLTRVNTESAKGAPRVAPTKSNLPFIVASYVVSVIAPENDKILVCYVCTQSKPAELLDKFNKELDEELDGLGTSSFSVVCTRP